MTSPAALHQNDHSDSLASRLASRGDLTSFLMSVCDEIGADNYMLVAIVHDQDKNDARIVSSNWIFDAIELIGRRLIAGLAQGPLTAAPGIRPHAAGSQQRAGRERPADRRRSPPARRARPCRNLFAAAAMSAASACSFSFRQPKRAGSIQPALMKAQLQCCYALSQIPQLLAPAAMQDPLSDRERECLFWVSEGKTTDEVAVILGVSSNTVNSYITHAIQKFAASNRAMAIATAIRSGII